MSDPWAAASRGFSSGVQLGVRSSERAEDKEERETARTLAETQRTEDVAFRSRGREIEEAREARASKEFDAKETAKIVGTKMQVATAYVNTGNNLAAGKTIMDMYPDIKNGDEVLVLQREFDKTGVFEGIPENVNVFIQSKLYGNATYKDMREAVKAISGMVDAKGISESMKANETRLAKKNLEASEKPFTSGDAQWIKQYGLDSAGNIIQADPVPFKGLKEDPKVRTGLTEELGRPPTQAEMGVKLGLRAKPKATTGKDDLTAEGKKLTNMKKSLAIAFKEFGGSGKEVYNAKTREFTTEGKNVIREAQKVVDSGENGPRLARAKEALALFEKYRRSVTGATEPQWQQGPITKKFFGKGGPPPLGSARYK